MTIDLTLTKGKITNIIPLGEGEATQITVENSKSKTYAVFNGHFDENYLDKEVRLEVNISNSVIKNTLYENGQIVATSTMSKKSITDLLNNHKKILQEIAEIEQNYSP